MKMLKVFQMSGKPCRKRKKLLVTRNFCFPTLFSKDLYCRHVKTMGCLGKGYSGKTFKKIRWGGGDRSIILFLFDTISHI